MSDRNDDGDEFGLLSRTLGGLPVNQVVGRLGLPALLADALPVEDARLKLAPAGVPSTIFSPSSVQTTMFSGASSS